MVYRKIQQFWGAPRLKLRNSSLACRLAFLKYLEENNPHPRLCLEEHLRLDYCVPHALLVCVCVRVCICNLSCKICGFSVAVPKSQALDRSSVGSGHLFLTSLQRANATSCLLSPLNQNGVGVHFVTGRRHSNSVLSSYCNHMCQLATCGVYTVDSEISLYGLHYPLEYDLLVRFKVKAATKTGLHLNYYL